MTIIVNHPGSVLGSYRSATGRSATGRWVGGDMGERFIPGAAQAAEHVNNNTITTHGARISVKRWAGSALHGSDCDGVNSDRRPRRRSRDTIQKRAPVASGVRLRPGSRPTAAFYVR